MADNRTVLHALPEEQPDNLGKGSKSKSIHAKPSKKTDSKKDDSKKSDS